MEERVLERIVTHLRDEMDQLERDEEVLASFLEKHLGRKKLLVVSVSEETKDLHSALAVWEKERGYEVLSMDGTSMTQEALKALAHKKEQKLLVVMDNFHALDVLPASEEAALFRCILDYADPANDEYSFHEESAFLFLAKEGFPAAKLATVSLTWAYESAFLDLRIFGEKIVAHMGRYKERVLRLAEQVDRKGFTYDHILPEKHYELNFSPYIRERRIGSKYLSKILWHRFSHHLNSSQVMGVNFMYPLIAHQEMEAFLSSLSIEGAPLYDPEHMTFKKQSPLEEPLERKSCFDFHMTLANGKEVYVVMRYTEGCYGRGQGEELMEKYDTLYGPLLKDHPMILEEKKTKAFFMEEYRFMRTLLHLKEDTYVVVVYPKENYHLRRHALKLRGEALTKEGQEHFIPVVWEELLESLLRQLKSNHVATYYETWFKDKYFRY